tara:strand:+ start:502 stop:618 length:117 start_codon:yes stop_codon:yes gene_type:complete
MSNPTGKIFAAGGSKRYISGAVFPDGQGRNYSSSEIGP